MKLCRGRSAAITARNNDHGDPLANRLAGIKESASPNRFDEHEDRLNNLTQYSYRLRDQNDDGPIESLYGFVISDDGHLQMAVYFDNPADGLVARQLVENVTERGRTPPA